MPWPMRFGPDAEDHDARAGSPRRDLVAAASALPARVVVGRRGRELGGAGVDRLERALAGERRARDRARARCSSRRNQGSIAVRLVQRPRCSTPRRSASRMHVEAVGAPGARARSSSVLVGALERRGGDVELARAHRLRERLLEGAADRHRLADRLHVRGQAGVGAGELLEGEARPLDDEVVDRRLEAGRRAPVMSLGISSSV